MINKAKVVIKSIVQGQDRKGKEREKEEEKKDGDGSKYKGMRSNGGNCKEGTKTTTGWRYG